MAENIAGRGRTEELELAMELAMELELAEELELELEWDNPALAHVADSFTFVECLVEWENNDEDPQLEKAVVGPTADFCDNSADFCESNPIGTTGTLDIKCCVELSVLLSSFLLSRDTSRAALLVSLLYEISRLQIVSHG